MPTRQDLQPGDILIQSKGFPWVQGAAILCGHPYPHARIVSTVQGDFVQTLEETPLGVMETVLMREGSSGLALSSYRVFRPLCDSGTRCNALNWIRHRLGERYDYDRLMVIVLGSALRLGYYQSYSDTDTGLDDRPMICSELIARGYFRAGYDIVPHISSRSTMPWDIVSSPVLIEVL